MEDIGKKIEQLGIKIKKLINKCETIEKENIKLKEQISDLQIINEELKKELKNLQEKNNFLKIAKSLTINEEERNELKINIEEMEREVEKCIALLKN